MTTVKVLELGKVAMSVGALGTVAGNQLVGLFQLLVGALTFQEALPAELDAIESKRMMRGRRSRPKVETIGLRIATTYTGVSTTKARQNSVFRPGQPKLLDQMRDAIRREVSVSDGATDIRSLQSSAEPLSATEHAPANIRRNVGPS